MSRPGLINPSIGDYRLVDYIGAGGMGEVYRAVHSKIGRVVAVKVLTHAVPNSSFITRFTNEARIQASLHHQNIATLYDFLEFNKQPCIIIEYIDGQTLTERIQSLGALPIAEALYIFQAVTEAIHYVHSHGVVHRDIKSNNVKISSTGEVKLIDFGIAKAGDTPSLTMTGDVVGTLEYLSPEQVKGGAADARCDIWALGVLLYEMVAGHVPFKSPTIGDLCDKICRAAYAPPSTLNKSVPSEVEAIISRCLKKRPSDRYQTALELLQQTKRLTASLPAPRLSTTDNKKFFVSARKNWTILSAGAALVLAVFIGIYLVIPSPDKPTQPPPKPPDSQTVRPVVKPQIPLEHYRIETTDGMATVELSGKDRKLVGQTPFEFDAPVGEKFNMVLRRDGYKDFHDELTVTVSKHQYSYTMMK